MEVGKLRRGGMGESSDVVGGRRGEGRLTGWVSRRRQGGGEGLCQSRAPFTAGLGHPRWAGSGWGQGGGGGGVVCTWERVGRGEVGHRFRQAGPADGSRAEEGAVKWSTIAG